MKKHTLSRVGAVTALGAGMLFTPALATAANATPMAPSIPFAATPVATQTTEGASCTVTGGTLTWGLKETFRSYIKSSIAKGDWETLEGAAYELPNFVWSNPTGEFDPTTGEGAVEFEGVLHFTGHGGVLDMWLGNPTFEIGQDGKLSLFFDARSNDTDGNPKVEVTQEYFADLGTVDPVTLTEGETTTVTYENVETLLTEEGVPAFGDFYVAGDVLDPVTLTFDVACETAAPAEPEVPAEPETENDAAEAETVDEPAAEESAESTIPWLPIGIGAGAIAVLAVAGTLFARNRKNGNATQDTTHANG